MRARILNLIVAGTALLLFALYLFLNYPKLESVSSDWAAISAGKTPVDIRLELAGEILHQRRLKDSEIFDVAGVRQIYFVHLPQKVFARVQKDIEAAELLIDQQKVPLSKTENKSALLAVTADKRVYLLEEGELKYMMTVIWNERLHANNIVQCMTAEICASIGVSSRHWGPVQGAFPDSDISPERRGMPKGRWIGGPKAVLNIQSAKRQEIQMQINLLSLHQDMELSVRGAASQVQRVDTNATLLEAGGRSFYPGVYVVLLDLHAGSNPLELAFSEWDEPVRKGANPLAAYLTLIILNGTGPR
ncbi:MAG: hypothetical protein WBS20_15635 [Lysobacterales bacterium]